LGPVVGGERQWVYWWVCLPVLVVFGAGLLGRVARRGAMGVYPVVAASREQILMRL
jgi:hypothetical protein